MKLSLLQIEREKDELNLQLRHAEALRKSYELLQENDYNVIKLRQSLQASHLNMLNAKKQLENAEIQVLLNTIIIITILTILFIVIILLLH